MDDRKHLSAISTHRIRVVFGDPKRSCHGFGICRLDSERRQLAQKRKCGCDYGRGSLLQLPASEKLELRIACHDFHRFIQPEIVKTAQIPAQKNYPLSSELRRLLGLTTHSLYPLADWWEFAAPSYAFITLTSHNPFPDE